MLLFLTPRTAEEIKPLTKYSSIINTGHGLAGSEGCALLAKYFLEDLRYQNLANKNDRPRRAWENNCLRIRTLKTDDEIWLASAGSVSSHSRAWTMCFVMREGGGCGQISGDVSEHVRPVWTDLASSSRNQNHFLYFLPIVAGLPHFINWDSLSLSLLSPARPVTS